MCSTDLSALRDFFAGLSTQTRTLRFFAPLMPTTAMLGRLSGGGAGVDAVIAITDGAIIGHAMAVDQPTRMPAGQPARAVDQPTRMSAGQPTWAGDQPTRMPADQPTPAGDQPTRMPAGQPARAGGRAADLGVVVADAWQGRGVGSALTRALVGRALARGVTSLTMDVLPVNQRALAMIRGHWPAASFGRCQDSITVRAPLPAAPAAARPGPGLPVAAVCANVTVWIP